MQATSLSVLKSFNIIIVDKVAGFDAGYYRHMFSLLFPMQDIPSHLSDHFFLRILQWIYQLRILMQNIAADIFPLNTVNVTL